VSSDGPLGPFRFMTCTNLTPMPTVLRRLDTKSCAVCIPK